MNRLGRRLCTIFATLFATAVIICLSALCLRAQETTGGLQGTIKDQTGAVVPGAHVSITGTGLVGTKETDTDSGGHYNFANLPPGTYEITVTATGFSTLKQSKI